MSETSNSSDMAIIDLLRQHGERTVGELSELMGVTLTAVRQRLNRLMEHGYVHREKRIQSRGRPTHGYTLTAEGRRRAGENFADLATALWEEVIALPDSEIRTQLIEGIAKRLAKTYETQVAGGSLAERMGSIATLFESRKIPMVVEDLPETSTPTLKVMACPYPDLVDEDATICQMETTLLSELTGQSLRLDGCSHEGGNCCKFVTTLEPNVSTVET
ncbi:MAG: winged helix-turn-helix transcriptional regulator [Planctomycetota bacterium]|nr:winged helix-turn-helix transcriptional regulator [Planctomycetota bacterium]MEC8302255.1 winged helix-turn-helix transcriptional regulator [Planctomycetota bacterium]